MNKDQALHYAGILLNKLEQFEARATGLNIHNSKVYRATLDGYIRATKDNRFSDALEGLNEAILGAEQFLANQWR
jgi:hypothetical protein